MVGDLRRPGALDGHPDRAAALAAVDEHWNPAWPPGWRRHYAAVREPLREEEGQAVVLPGVTMQGRGRGVHVRWRPVLITGPASGPCWK
ncbi:hypothetical protein C6N75_15925 [Streptomyces solincola]|uniref:Uncharacterized protein n=1 Tax=Streptomyces solincola TaxID=2100817 RepID=A0A2S9PUY6_9ACTN|nr:hypothetical protein [Streptomyces solincola]PRH78240.1 hypothetical protein C6N75_15925 [Streptomyces solincola]